MSKKISVIVITYNAQFDLKDCLNSLENQGFGNKELIVVNDASSDGTFEFLQEYKKHSSVEVKVINNDSNLGVAGSRNVGIKHSTGDIIAFTDADCEADQGWISELVKMYGNKDTAAVVGRVFAKRLTNIWELTEKGHDFVASIEGYVSRIVGCNMSFRSKILRRYMFDDEIKYGYEEALLCDYLNRDGHKIYYTPRAIVYHKHKSDLVSLLKRKYLLGLSSIWYRKKQKKLLMFKRHIMLLIALLLVPLSAVNGALLFLSFFLFLVFSFSLIKDEVIYKERNMKEIVRTFPFLIFVEFAHFMGSIAGLFKFRILKLCSKDS